jgi:hypothetical protein
MTSAPKVLRYVTFALMALFGVLGGLFIVGETMLDPGGIAGVLLSASWVVPTVAMAVYAVRRPETATKVLAVIAVLAALFVVVDAVAGIVPRNEIGPVGSIVVFAVAVALGFLGLYRPVPAGWLLLLVGGANLAGVVAKTIEPGDGAPLGAALGGSSGAVAVPVLVIGALFLLAGYWESRSDRAHARVIHPKHRVRSAH